MTKLLNEEVTGLKYKHPKVLLSGVAINSSDMNGN